VAKTVAVLVEEAEGLLELGDLFVGELVRHGNPSGDLTEGGKQAGRQRGKPRIEEIWKGDRGERKTEAEDSAVSGQRQSQTDQSLVVVCPTFHTGSIRFIHDKSNILT
jgi:hypothetical protein